MGDVNELQKKGTKTMANLPGSIKNLNTLLGEQLLEGGGSGGGGSSDFSTAEVTFKNPTTTDLNIRCCYINDNNILSSILPLGATSTKTYTVVLYKGSQQVDIPFGAELTIATGDITVDDEEGVIIINGAGTVLFQQ